MTDILASAPRTDLVMEPDNEKTSVLASCLKSELPRFPELSAEEPGPSQLHALWQSAFNSDWAPLLSRGWTSSALCRLRSASTEAAIARKPLRYSGAADTNSPCGLLRFVARLPAPRRSLNRIIKSVHAVLYAEWIAERFQPAKVVVIMRHPVAVIQSWRRLRMPDATRLTAPSNSADGPEAERANLRDMARQLSLMYSSLFDAMRRHPQWLTVWHESLCQNPAANLRAVAEKSGIGWDARMDKRISRLNRAGEGYTAEREASREIDKWRGEVTSEEIRAIEAVFADAGLQGLV